MGKSYLQPLLPVLVSELCEGRYHVLFSVYPRIDHRPLEHVASNWVLWKSFSKLWHFPKRGNWGGGMEGADTSLHRLVLQLLSVNTLKSNWRKVHRLGRWFPLVCSSGPFVLNFLRHAYQKCKSISYSHPKFFLLELRINRYIEKT